MRRAGGPLDFTSALYLGLRHASDSLRPWAQLTTGRPAALGESSSAHVAAELLARLTGTDRGLLARSTLHAFWDVVPLLAGGGQAPPAAIHVDVGTYPIARWGVERAGCRGAPVATFAHHDPEALERRVRRAAGRGLRPLVVADGACPGCGGLAPVAAYLEVALSFGGRLLLDDTQALGILGPEGGGSLRRARVGGPDVTLVSSLAKGFGAPLAFVGGTEHDVARLEAGSQTRVHSSPPSLADVHAALHALRVNETEGDLRRQRLRALVKRFWRGLRELGLGRPTGGALPMQQLSPIPSLPATELDRRLRLGGVHAVLQRPCCDGEPRVTFLITAGHEPWQIDRALEVLRRSVDRDWVGRLDRGA